MKPLVSILIPAYNAENSIAEAMQLAIAQTWPRKEIIVVDDASQIGHRKWHAGLLQRMLLLSRPSTGGYRLL